MNIEKDKLLQIIKANSKTITTASSCIILATLLSIAVSNRGDMKVLEYDLGRSETKVADLEEELAKKEESIIKLEDEVIALEEKLATAKPFFDMEASKQRELEEQVAKEAAERLAREEEEKLALLQEAIEAKTVELSNGNFLAGVDFEGGTYDIIAVKGNGNVSSDNMYNGGLNAIMGVSSNEMYEKEYKNIRLPSGTSLKISGVTVKLVPKN